MEPEFSTVSEGELEAVVSIGDWVVDVEEVEDDESDEEDEPEEGAGVPEDEEGEGVDEVDPEGAEEESLGPGVDEVEVSLGAEELVPVVVVVSDGVDEVSPPEVVSVVVPSIIGAERPLQY